MTKGRVEAFSDCVISILITIMVLDLRAPTGGGLAALWPELPVFLTYVLSYVLLGIYWSNHHHLFHATSHINGKVLWANLHLLFWLSLVPFVTSWMGRSFGPIPVAAYGIVLLMAAVSWTTMQALILRIQGSDSRLREAIGNDRKGKVSLAIYLAAVLVAFVSPALACAGYVAVALLWLVPDRRIESLVAE
jgi:uncharacterized membrane protein